MKEHFDKAIEWIKQQDINGAITGSCLLEHFPDSDIDVFVYDEKSFIRGLFAMHYNPMFQILDPIELWKFNQVTKKETAKSHKFGLSTIKFYYNTCVPVNIILKQNCTNIFSVLASFDLDIICKGFDIKSQQYLDLTAGSSVTKIANYNKWNLVYYSEEIWEISRILRQIQRCIKYYKRGYNTDAVVEKYISLIDNVEKYESIFNSANFTEKLELVKTNTKILKQICNVWLDTHEISEKELELLEKTVKLL